MTAPSPWILTKQDWELLMRGIEEDPDEYSRAAHERYLMWQESIRQPARREARGINELEAVLSAASDEFHDPEPEK
jgi:hypothetical protein